MLQHLFIDCSKGKQILIQPAQDCAAVYPLLKDTAPSQARNVWVAYAPARGVRSLPVLCSLAKASAEVTPPCCLAPSTVHVRGLATAGATALENAEQQPHLEEVDLHSAIAEVQDDGAAGPEPRAEIG